MRLTSTLAMCLVYLANAEDDEAQMARLGPMRMSHRNAFRRITGQQSNLGGKGIDLGVAIIRASKLADHRSQSWRGDLRCKTTSLQVAEKSPGARCSARLLPSRPC